MPKWLRLSVQSSSYLVVTSIVTLKCPLSLRRFTEAFHFCKSAAGATIHCVRTQILYGVVILLFVTCLVCPVTQMFDRWDHELQSGQDTESAMVVVALCLGVTFSLVQAILRISRVLPSIRNLSACTSLGSLQFPVGAAADVLASASPPPAILRI
jgi:hypothetical protein